MDCGFILVCTGNKINNVTTMIIYDKDGRQINYVCDINGINEDAIYQFVQTNICNVIKYHQMSLFVDVAKNLYLNFCYDGNDCVNVYFVDNNSKLTNLNKIIRL